MKILVLSYDTPGGAATALLEEAAAAGAQTESMALKELMTESRRQLRRNSGFVQKAKAALSALYRPYDPLDTVFISALTESINTAGFDAVVCMDNKAIRTASAAKRCGLSPMCYAMIADYEAASVQDIGMLDGCFIAHEELKPYLIRHGIRSDRLYHFGLPVAASFKRRLSKRAARNYLVIPQEKRVYLFLAGEMRYEEVRDICVGMLDTEDEDFLLYVLLPRDSEIKEPLEQKFRGENSIRVITLTKKLDIYMEGADVVLTKPLAFESYEAAVAGAPIVHIMSFRDSERRLAEFFSSHEMSLKASGVRDAIQKARRLAHEQAVAARMSGRQRRLVRADAAAKILETIISNKKGKRV